MCLWEKTRIFWNKILLLKASLLPLMDFSVKSRKRLQYAIRAQRKQDEAVLCYISVLLTY